jgi:hypothetical protein
MFVARTFSSGMSSTVPSAGISYRALRGSAPTAAAAAAPGSMTSETMSASETIDLVSTLCYDRRRFLDYGGLFMANAKELQEVHHAVLEHFVATGRAPHYTELAETLGVPLERARELVHETTVESPFSFAWIVPDTDYISAWAPFSNIPTNNLVTVDGAQKWYGQ